MLPIMYTAIIACAVMVSVTAPYSLMLALLGGPIFGSFAGLSVAFFQAWHRGADWSGEEGLDQQMDAMVSVLRNLAEQGTAVDANSSKKSGKSFQSAMDMHSSGVATSSIRAAQ